MKKWTTILNEEIAFFDRELKRLGGHYINETPSLFLIVLVSFLCFCAKRLFTVYVFGEFFFHSVRFWWIFLSQCTFWVNFSSVYVLVNFQYAWFNSFQLFTHSKNSLQYQFDNSHSVLIIARGILGISVYKTILFQWHKIESSVFWGMEWILF